MFLKLANPGGPLTQRYGGAVQGGSGQDSDSGREEGVQSLELWSERYSDHSNDSAYVLVDSKLNAAWPRGSILEADWHSSPKRGKSKRKNSGNRTEACFWADPDNTTAPKSILKKVKAEEGNDTVEDAGEDQEELAGEAEPGDEDSENLSNVSRQDLVEDGLGMSIGGIAPDIEEEPSSQAFPEQTQDEPQESQDMRSKQVGRPRVVAVQVQKFLEVTPKDRREHVRLTVSRSPDPPSGDVQKRLRFAINEDDRPSVEKPPEDPRPPGGQGTLCLDITVTTPRDRVTSRQSPPNNMKR
ncbi:hypothetical protein AAG570_006735 [Ranatra chinensis]|uniref:Uncharacterized protein n=1 Tax=Ranatra chinensis TaxID=642074 RepID=A0ABD0YUY1_9HEMI